jgi:hypothetical protein
VKVLVACEYSGTVRDAFRAKGHDAWSCDLLPTDGDPEYHYQGDVFDIIGDGWDLMIAHPPCTHLAVSGARHFAEKRADGRQQAALAFVQRLLDTPIDKIALEKKPAPEPLWCDYCRCEVYAKHPARLHPRGDW